MIITTQKQKSQHPIAKNIPQELWADSNYFQSSFDEGTFNVGTKSFAEINREDLPKNNRQALILLMICYPNLPFSQYARLQLPIDDQELFQISVCMGRLDILMELKAKAPTQFMVMVKPNIFDAFFQACLNGHLDTAKWLKEMVSHDEFLAMVRKNEYEPFRKACANGHLGIAQWLKENAPDEFMAMVEASEYHAFLWACGNGHLNTAQWLKENVPGDEFMAMMKINNHAALRAACAQGHLETAKWLKKYVTDDEFIAIVKEYHYAAFNWACANGHLDTAKWLKENMPADEFMTMVKADNYDGFVEACANGHVEVAEWLKKHMSTDEFMALVRVRDYYVFRSACLNGNLGSAKWLKENAPDEFIAMVKANNFCAFAWACSRNHLGTVEWLKENAPDEFVAMVKKDDYYAFQSACANGHLNIAKWLKNNAPNEFIAMVKSGSFYPLRSAFTHGHEDIVQWLLQDVACFAYAEAHVQEYSGLVNPLIDNALSNLHLESETFSTQNPNGVFNLTDPARSRFCFYMLRNLIRRNDRALDDDIRFLLAIPAVKALVHQSVHEGPENELLRLAMSIGNQEAIALLMTIDVVRRLAEEHDYYQEEARYGIDVRQFALDRESSMTALTQGEAQRLKAAIDVYQPMIKTTGIHLLLKALKDHLQSEYENQPATITTHGQQIIPLPMAHKDFLALGLKGEDEQRALKAYYQHPAHTAWHYLSKPNPWMHPEASYVCVNEDGTERWSTFEEYLPLIVMLYLAVIDTANPPSEDHTFESRLSHFINELALLGRAHNWDKKRLNQKGILEEYDDLEGDRPSCFSGVKRRLFQSVISHPLISILTKENIRADIRQFAFQHFKAVLEKNDSLALRKIFADVMVALDDTNVDELACFNIPDEKQKSLKDALDKKYGEQFTTNAALVMQVKQAFHLDPKAQASHERYHVLSTLLHCPSEFYDYLVKTPPLQGNDAQYASLESRSGVNPASFFHSKPSENIPCPTESKEHFSHEIGAIHKSP